jgi:hypothetical protein|tara:strand:- start:219 stop:533 length:315 start_codon:yes stop_codon:yes gene_type:complete
MTASTLTINLESSFDEIYAQLEAAKKDFDKVKVRRDLIQQIRLTCAVAVGTSMSGRDMFDSVLSAATSGTMRGFKTLSGHRNHDYIDANYRDELMSLATQLRDL